MDESSSTSYNQQGQDVHGHQLNAAGDVRIDHFGDTIILTEERPSLWAGVPAMPRFGLIGRSDLLDELLARLTAVPAAFVALTGPGGAGKTALAVAAARDARLLEQFPGGVLWASVGPDGDPAQALSRWAQALGLDPAAYPGAQALKTAVQNAIGPRQLLLVLDDIWDEAHAALLRCGGPNCAYLLTTRDVGIARSSAGGRRHVLAVPELDEDRAYLLLERIAPEACAVDADAARALVRQVGGLPLAVELLGGYLVAGGGPDAAIFPDISAELLHDLADPALRLRQAQEELGGGGRVTLAGVIALGLAGFAAPERQAFYALGAFAARPATFSREAAEAVSGADGRLLSRLVNRNLLEIREGALAMHQVTADLARQHMAPLAPSRHAAHYLALANEHKQDWRRIDAAYAQMRRAAEQAEGEALLAWIGALTDHQARRGYWGDAQAWLERGLAAARANDWLAEQVVLLNHLAALYRDAGRRSEALALFEEALPIARAGGDRAAEAATLNNIGMVYEATGRPSEALAYFEQALPIRRETADRAGEAVTLNSIAMIYQATGHPAEALRRFEALRPLLQELGDRGGEAAALNNMGMVTLAVGRPVGALRLFEEALALRRELGDRNGEATTLNNIGLVYKALGRQPEALQQFEAALPIMREVGNRAREATVLGNMAAVQQDMGRLAEALELFQQALPIVRETGDRVGEATLLNNIAGIMYATGRADEALGSFEEALAILRAAGDRAGEAAALGNLAMMVEAAGRHAEAVRLYEQALPIAREAGDRAGEAMTLNNLALAYYASGQTAKAMPNLVAALAMMREVGNRPGEAMTLANMALLLVEQGQKEEGITTMREAVDVLAGSALSRDATGATIEQYRAILFRMEHDPDM